MMKVLVVLCMFLGAAADAERQAQCAFDGSQAVSQLSDVVVFLWAATERCGSNGNPLAPKCEVDIASAIKAVNDMIMVIADAAEKCEAVDTVGNHDCGMAVGGLTSAAAALAASTGGIVSDCPGKHPANVKFGTSGLTTVGKCFTDAKNAVGDLFKATLKLSKVTKTCEAGSAECTRNALNIIAFFSDMGSALAHAVDHCGQVEGKDENRDAACTAAALAGVSALHNVADAGVKVSTACKVADVEAVEIERKYQLERVTNGRASGSMPTMMVGAFLPIFAVLGFFAGSKFAKGRTQGREAEMVRMIDDEEQ